MTSLIQTCHNPWIVLEKPRVNNIVSKIKIVVLKLVLIPNSSKWLEKHSWPDVRTNLGDHGNHGTQRLLSIGVVHCHLLTKVTEKLATIHNM